MFGHKFRAWMDAVRTKKKQHRKEKQGKGSNNITPNGSTSHNHHTVTWKANTLIADNPDETTTENKTRYIKNHCKNGPTNSHISRYSANNLSSPESAYSTGYSTDGTSPGAPPDYVLNTARKTDADVNTKIIADAKLKYSGEEISGKCLPNSHKIIMSPLLVRNTQDILGKHILETHTIDSNTSSHSPIFYGKITESTTAGLVSPRQRNRIRTNPWLPGGTPSATPTPLPVRQEIRRTPLSRNHRDSPIQTRYLSPAKHRRSLSSSSCSSLSGAISFDHHLQRSLSDEEDCTLNEMMGKFDESYVYERETDILSDDSDPTDCESDIDTGQDGGDEDDTADLDFIDNGSCLEIDFRPDNTGHCSYFDTMDIQRRRLSRRRNARKTKEGSSNRRRSSNKKCHHKHFEKARHSSLHQDGSRSAGATPVSVRRSNLEKSNLKSSQEVKRRSNSVCVQRDCSILIEKRDKEADKKYRELIGQAEQIIRTMNINGLSPRRLSAPTNKRIELLKSTECSKNEVLLKSVKPLEENSAVNNAPSNVTLKNSRFSPKKNHITNFIINNSPVLLKKELQGQSPLAHRRNEESPLVARKYPDTGVLYRRKIYDIKPCVPEVHVSQKTVHQSAYSSRIAQPKSILYKNENGNNMFSPRHRRANKNMTLGSSSSEEEEFQKVRKKLSKSCPQSEPVRRKVYFGRNTINYTPANRVKTVAFQLQDNLNSNLIQASATSSAENLRQQVLLNTIQTLKRDLEDQSAFLQQNYSSTQNMYQFGKF